MSYKYRNQVIFVSESDRRTCRADVEFETLRSTTGTAKIAGQEVDVFETLDGFLQLGDNAPESVTKHFE